jgi:hypothetical protein
LATNNDLKIESLDEALLSTSNNPTTPATSKKRKADQNDISFVKLTREQLLVMSSQEFEERVRLLQNMRPLTLAEEEETKRQRKLIKNREYAQTSRIKKRETLSSLQVQLTAVNTENHILKSHINNLSQQVQYLQVENHQLRMMLSSYSLSPPTLTTPNITTQSYPILPTTQNPHLSFNSSPESSVYSNDENDPLGVITSDSDENSLAIDFTSDQCLQLPSGDDQYSYLSGKNWMSENYTTGLCLLVILFSFGLFFNGVLLEGISVMVAPSLAEGGSTTTTGRTLFNAPDYKNNDLELNDDSIVKGMLPVEMIHDEVSESCNETEQVWEKEGKEKLKLLMEAENTKDLTPYL